MFFAVVIAVLATAVRFSQPEPRCKNLGVVWTDSGTLLKVVYRESGNLFERHWDFSDFMSNRGEELETFPYSESTHFKVAFTAGKAAYLKGGYVVVEIETSVAGYYITQEVYGCVVG